MGGETVKAKRPIIITIMCIIGFIGAAFSIPLAFSSLAQAIGPWYPPSLLVSSVAGIAAMIGFWLMKKWALYIYIAMVVLNQILLVVTQTWSFASLGVPGIIVLVGVLHFKQMS